MRRWWIGAVLGLVAMVVGGGYYLWKKENISPLGKDKKIPELYLERYDFDNLRRYRPSGGKIQILGEIPEVEIRRKNQNSKEKSKNEFVTREIRFQSEGKLVSGMINYHPEKSSLSPIIIMVRGYAEKAGYYPGSGSWRVADKLAASGYATISLDFLGYGRSEVESSDMLEARFHKVVEVLDLLAAVEQIPWVDKNKIGFWAHSNGGQIVLSVLEITGGRYPTVLWAPMTLPFPDSVLSTIDPGSPVKAAIEEFARHYDSRRYAFENYYHWIRSPILIQQGTADGEVNPEWQEKVIKGIGRSDTTLVVYEGADHNMAGPAAAGWKEAVERDIEWFYENL